MSLRPRLPRLPRLPGSLGANANSARRSAASLMTASRWLLARYTRSHGACMIKLLDSAHIELAAAAAGPPAR